jgi:pyridoxal/pyridoxine/pyridoxamine kinase
MGGLTQLAKGADIIREGPAYLHAGERVLTKDLTGKLDKQISNINNGGDVHLHISGFMGGQQEINNLVEIIERKVLPKINKSKGIDPRRVVAG